MRLFKNIRNRYRYWTATSRKIGFVVAGTQKGGTSALDSYLRLHPEICMARKKEVHFFDRDYKYYRFGKPDYRTYHAYFTPLPSHKILGESTPDYMWWLEAPRRIWEYNPDMKLIVVLRNPIDRAYSNWNMERDRERESRPFWEAIQKEVEVCRESLPFQNKVYSYINRGFYSEQLRRLLLYFPKDNIFTLKSEELRSDPAMCLSRLSAFLGVADFPKIEPRTVHARPYTSAMSDQEREHLRAVFEHDIRQLEQLLDWDCSSWLSE